MKNRPLCRHALKPKWIRSVNATPHPALRAIFPSRGRKMQNTGCYGISKGFSDAAFSIITISYPSWPEKKNAEYSLPQNSQKFFECLIFNQYGPFPSLEGKVARIAGCGISLPIKTVFAEFCFDRVQTWFSPFPLYHPEKNRFQPES